MSASTIEEALREIAALRARIGALEDATGLFASDSELSGPKGNPVVKFSPSKRWRGKDMKGARLGQCPPDFLDVYAEALQYSAEHPKVGKEQYADYDRKDAARARGWARRLRAEGAVDEAPQAPGFGAAPSFGGSSSFGGAKFEAPPANFGARAAAPTPQSDDGFDDDDGGGGFGPALLDPSADFDNPPGVGGGGFDDDDSEVPS